MSGEILHVYIVTYMKFPNNDPSNNKRHFFSFNLISNDTPGMNIT